MKNIFFALIFASAGLPSKAQQGLAPMVKAIPLPAHPPRPKLTGTTALGKVYAMPTDQMPCLVPGAAVTVPMPTARVQPFSPMPNPFQQDDTNGLLPDSSLRVLPAPLPGPKYFLKKIPLQQ